MSFLEDVATPLTVSYRSRLLEQRCAFEDNYNAQQAYFPSAGRNSYQAMDIPRPAAPTRTSRKRQKADRVKRMDEIMIREARARRLEALENDNYAQEREAEMLQGEDEYQPGLNSDEEITVKKRKSKKRRVRRARGGNGNPANEITDIARFNKSITAVLEEEDGMQLLPGMVSLSSITARPSRFAERRFCSICGYEAKYTCLTCGARYCSIPCDQVHQETRCLKFMA